MKNSGGCSRRDTNHVFDFLGRNVEVAGNVGDAVAGDEPIDEILDPSAAVGHNREAEGDRRIDDHLRTSVGRKTNARGEPIAAVRDPSKVVAYKLGELVLPCPDHHKLQKLIVAPLVGVVVEDLGAIGVQPLRRERVL